MVSRQEAPVMGSPAPLSNAVRSPQSRCHGFALRCFYFPLNTSPCRALSPYPAATVW